MDVEKEVVYNEHLVDTLDVFMKKNNGLIWKVINKFRKAIANTYHTMDDLYSLGAMGMIKAYKKYDPTFTGVEGKPVRFSTYAVPMIKGEIMRELRDKAEDMKYRRPTKELANQIFREDLVDKSPEYISMQLDVSEDDVKEAMGYIYNRRAASMDAEIFTSSDSDAVTLYDQIPNGSHQDIEYNLLEQDMLSVLTEREKMLYDLSYKQDMSQADIGTKLGITQVQVSRLLVRVKSKLASYFGLSEDEVKSRSMMNANKYQKNRRGSNMAPSKGQQVMRLLKLGMSVKQIETELNVSSPTVYKWRSELMKYDPEYRNTIKPDLSESKPERMVKPSVKIQLDPVVPKSPVKYEEKDVTTPSKTDTGKVIPSKKATTEGEKTTPSGLFDSGMTIESIRAIKREEVLMYFQELAQIALNSTSSVTLDVEVRIKTKP